MSTQALKNTFFALLIPVLIVGFIYGMAALQGAGIIPSAPDMSHTGSTITSIVTGICHK